MENLEGWKIVNANTQARAEALIHQESSLRGIRSQTLCYDRGKLCAQILTHRYAPPPRPKDYGLMLMTCAWGSDHRLAGCCALRCADFSSTYITEAQVPRDRGCTEAASAAEGRLRLFPGPHPPLKDQSKASWLQREWCGRGKGP